MTITYIKKDVNPAEYIHRPFHYRDLAKAGAVFAEIDGLEGAIADHYGEDRNEAALMGELAIADLSAVPRTGFKGRTALAWLDAEGATVPGDNNTATRQPDGGLVARLADSEAMVLGALKPGDGLVRRLDDGWSMDGADGCYLVPRRSTSFWFVITGARASDMFAKICGVDLREKAFGPGAIAQTSVARSNTIIIRDPNGLGGVPAFHVLGDSASAGYMWMCLQDAMDEFNGGPVGFATLLG